MRGEQHTVNLTADAQPFGLERAIDGRRSYLFFPGIEADCGTEPLDASDADRSSIAKKFAAYAAIAEQGIHSSHFGFETVWEFYPKCSAKSVRRLAKL